MSASNGTAAVTVRDTLATPTIGHTMDGGRFNLLKQTFAKGVTDEAAIYAALEVAAKYDLDPLAKGEIWCTQDKRGDVLLMVGRDGLRKIAQRAGLDIDCDVVRANDTFRVTRAADRSRAIEHEYSLGGDTERGEILGAWAEVWDRETGAQRGYYFAPLVEWKPTHPAKLQYSPWGTQESVMILAAAERQALRQATPLSGLLTEGEMDLNDEQYGPEPVQLGDLTEVDVELVAMLAEVVSEGVWTAQELAAQLVAHGAQTTGGDGVDGYEDALRSMIPTRREVLKHTVADALAVAAEREANADPETEPPAAATREDAEGDR